MLRELIARYRDGEMTLAEFVETAASNFVRRTPLGYPETDGAEDYTYGVSTASISNAVFEGLLTMEEAEAIYGAIPANA